MKKALLIVDVQNDFLPRGALAVKAGDEIIPIINGLMDRFPVIVASKDWHPADHGSFAQTHSKKPGDHIRLKGMDQILWPAHCVQNTFGADFPDELNKDKIVKVFYKGIDKEIDSYSAFFDNGQIRSTCMKDFLKTEKVTDLYLAGLATDYCVKYSALDAVKLGYRTFVIRDACRAVNLEEGDEEKAIQEMAAAGAKIIHSRQIEP